MPLKNISNQFRWNHKYDTMLSDLAKNDSKPNWPPIARAMKRYILESSGGQDQVFPTCKQCRERWYEHLDPAVSREAITNEDLEFIIEKRTAETPMRWVDIAAELKRPPNMVKNAYNQTVKTKKRVKVKKSPVIDEVTAVPENPEISIVELPLPQADCTPYFLNSSSVLLQNSIFTTSLEGVGELLDFDAPDQLCLAESDFKSLF